MRPILVDSLDGACHRAYGSMPSMSWVIDRGGRPVYKLPTPSDFMAGLDLILIELHPHSWSGGQGDFSILWTNGIF